MDKTDDIMNKFEERMETHDKRVEPIIKAKEKAVKEIKKMGNAGEVPDATMNQRIDYQIGVDHNGMVVMRFMAGGKPIKLSSMSFDTNGAMALANNLVKIVRSYQGQAPPTAEPV
jgi:hypothetical protein